MKFKDVKKWDVLISENKHLVVHNIIAEIIVFTNSHTVHKDDFDNFKFKKLKRVDMDLQKL